MKIPKPFFRSKDNKEKGVTIILVAVTLVVLLSIGAFAVDFGFGRVVKNQLQNSVDSAALAGAGTLGQQYIILGTVDESAVISAVQNFASTYNKAAKQTISLETVEVGCWDADNRTFDTTCTFNKNAVKVATRMDSEMNSPITTFFAKVFGVTSMNIEHTEAIAALTGQAIADPAEFEVPVMIFDSWFDQYPGPDGFCGNIIQFSPTNDSCAGWTTLSDEINSNKPNLIDILENGPSHTDPMVATKTRINLGGGETVPVQVALEQAWVDNNVDGKWHTKVPVVSGDCTTNPNQDGLVVGFAYVTILAVDIPPDDKQINVMVNCDIVETDDRGGGGNPYGTMGEIAGLVK